MREAYRDFLKPDRNPGPQEFCMGLLFETGGSAVNHRSWTRFAVTQAGCAVKLPGAWFLSEGLSSRFQTVLMAVDFSCRV